MFYSLQNLNDYIRSSEKPTFTEFVQRYTDQLPKWGPLTAKEWKDLESGWAEHFRLSVEDESRKEDAIVILLDMIFVTIGTHLLSCSWVLRMNAEMSGRKSSTRLNWNGSKMKLFIRSVKQIIRCKDLWLWRPQRA